MSKISNFALALALSPSGILYLDRSSENQEEISQKTRDKLEAIFKHSVYNGLLEMGLFKFVDELPSTFLFWQKFSQRFIKNLCHLVGHDQNDTINSALPSMLELQEFVIQAPLMKGIQYLNEELLITIWEALNKTLTKELELFSGNLKEFLNSYNSSWNLVGKVCFNLSENKNNLAAPFAFFATYTTQLTSNHVPQIMPLEQALEEYAGEKNESSLLALLIPIQRAALKSTVIEELINSGKIFQTVTWTPREAYHFLKDLQIYEAAGVVVQVPNWWNTQKPPRPHIELTVGKTASNIKGLTGMLGFELKITLGDGEELSSEEWQELLSSREQLVKVKGKWVEIDHRQLKDVLEYWQKIQKNINKKGLTFAEGVRLLSSAHMLSHDRSEVEAEFFEQINQWSSLKAGTWLKEQLEHLGNPEQLPTDPACVTLKNYLNGRLRPYQKDGVQWLWLLYNLKLGGCLADDMGLGKTIQMIGLLLLIKYNQDNNKPHLLIVPASLLGNWEQEIKRFAPTLTILFVHPSFNANFKENSVENFRNFDLVITTYAFAHRLKSLTELDWDLLILDEAQTIKNPRTKQTIAVKALKSNIRFVLTGTPIENSLSDLWSIFDFFAPGLLGSLKLFSKYSKNDNNSSDASKISRFNATIRSLANPYILRRLKTDKRIIADLPDKTEIDAYCSLSKEQVILYQQAVQELKDILKGNTDSIKRKGIIFSYLVRFKQLCNHPCQLVGYGSYEPSRSGKFIRIKEICEEIAAKQEKVLIFTQFQEIIAPLSHYLSTVFKRDGLILHGGIPIKKRTELVKAFSEEQGPPFFILSLKTGGTGLNLTNASHVIHFDRWWNPAVEEQATDRAYRIGQKRNVMVYKFICSGTIEEKINELIKAKQLLSTQILETENDILLTELTDEQLINIISLDIHKALDDH